MQNYESFAHTSKYVKIKLTWFGDLSMVFPELLIYDYIIFIFRIIKRNGSIF